MKGCSLQWALIFIIKHSILSKCQAPLWVLGIIKTALIWRLTRYFMNWLMLLIPTSQMGNWGIWKDSLSCPQTCKCQPSPRVNRGYAIHREENKFHAFMGFSFQRKVQSGKLMRQFVTDKYWFLILSPKSMTKKEDRVNKEKWPECSSVSTPSAPYSNKKRKQQQWTLVLTAAVTHLNQQAGDPQTWTTWRACEKCGGPLPEFLMQLVQGESWDFAFLTSSPVKLTLQFWDHTWKTTEQSMKHCCSHCQGEEIEFQEG